MVGPGPIRVNGFAFDRQSVFHRRRFIRPRAPDPYDNEIHGRNDPESDGAEEPSRADICDWLRLLAAPDQVIAVWVKQALRDGSNVNLGGFYRAAQVRGLVAHVMRYSGCAVGVHWAINPVDPGLLDDADHRLHQGLGPPKDSRVLCRRFLPIDIDPVRESDISATDEEKGRAFQRMNRVDRYLDELGWSKPAVVDSGNGYYLLYRVDLPAQDDGLVAGILKHLKHRFADKDVDIDTTVANPGRVLKIPGTMACKGEDSRIRPHRFSRLLKVPADGLRVTPRELLERLVGSTKRSTSEALPTPIGGVDAGLIQRARHYIAKMPPATSGQHGHDATLSVANRIVVGFNIPPTSGAALSLMREFNASCVPPWPEAQLLRKLHEADGLAQDRGHVRGSLRNATVDSTEDFAPLHGRLFPISVRDYSLVPAGLVLDRDGLWRKRTPAFGITTLMLLTERRSDVRIPDVVVRDIFWGAKHPQAWRRTLRKLHVEYSFRNRCSNDCPLSGRSVRHKHLVRPDQVFNGCLEELAEPPLPDDDNEPFPPRSYLVVEEAVQKLRAKRELFYCYAPLLVFGHSRALGLSASQARLMLGMTAELTRVGWAFDGHSGDHKKGFRPAASARDDRAEIIQGALVAPSGKQSRRIPCPLLDERRQYVVFGGNLHNRRGRGYSIIREQQLSWQRIAGFGGEDFESDSSGRLRDFLADLQVLSDLFELVPAARHHQRQEWKSLAEMKECLNTGVGRDWLHEATLRVFAPADYPTRWRYTIAKKLGFSWIPGTDCPFPLIPESETCAGINDGASLRKWLDQKQWTTARLASEMGGARETVSRHLSGSRNSPSFWRKLNTIAQRIDSAVTNLMAPRTSV